ncbi:MAG TPA: hypothetical protein VH482_17110 [Thermomicrobiales bacterium]|jgi:hypothetical protein
MDAMRFDALARSLAGFPVRRTPIDRVGGSSVPSRRRTHVTSRVVCPTDRVACDGTCLSPWVFQHDAKNCGACGTICAHGAVCCDGRCRDLTSDDANCGTCGAACPAGSSCAAGECI